MKLSHVVGAIEPPLIESTIGAAFDAAVAQRLRRFIYGAGNTLAPDDAYRAFRGRDPDVAPMLRKKGLLDAAQA